MTKRNYTRALLTAQLKIFSLPFSQLMQNYERERDFFSSKYIFHTIFLCATRLSVLNPFRRDKIFSQVKSDLSFTGN
jgi:hypothetical protein